MNRPRLPPSVEMLFDGFVLKTIYGFVPKYKKEEILLASPSLQRELIKLQSSPKLTAMALFGFDDFVLY